MTYRGVLVKTIAELPMECQRVLQLRLVEDLTGLETAAVLRISEFDAELEYFSALMELRQRLRMKT